MGLSKRFVIGALVAAVIVVLSPAMTASAAVWKDKGNNVTSSISLDLTGSAIIEAAPYGTISCLMGGELTTSGGSTGKIQKFFLTLCAGAGAPFNCTIKTTSLGLPWAVDVNATDLTVTNMRVQLVIPSPCFPSGTIDKTVSSTTWVLLSPSAIDEVEFLGQITGFKMFGSAFVLPEKTFGIG